MAQSPLRARLAELIGRQQELERQRAVLDAAAAPASSAVYAARATRDTAAAAIDEARAQALDMRINALAGALDDDAPEEPPLLEDARRRLRQAEDSLAAAEGARDAIEARSATNASALDLQRSHVLVQAREVLWSEAMPQVRSLVADMQRIQQELTTTARQLAVLHNNSPHPYPTDDPVAAQLRSLLGNCDRPCSSWDGARDRGELDERWRAALAQLQVDASARLPK